MMMMMMMLHLRLQMVANARTGRANPWLQNMQKTLQQYNIDTELAKALSKEQFHIYCANKAMEYLNTYWSQPPRHSQGATHSRYTESYGV